MCIFGGNESLLVVLFVCFVYVFFFCNLTMSFFGLFLDLKKIEVK